MLSSLIVGSRQARPPARQSGSVVVTLARPRGLSGSSPSAECQRLDHQLRRHDRTERGECLGPALAPARAHCAQASLKPRSPPMPTVVAPRSARSRASSTIGSSSGPSCAATRHRGHPSGHDRDRTVPQVGVGVAAHRAQAGLLELERGLQGGPHQQATTETTAYDASRRAVTASSTPARATSSRSTSPATRSRSVSRVSGSGASAVPERPSRPAGRGRSSLPGRRPPGRPA